MHSSSDSDIIPYGVEGVDPLSVPPVKRTKFDMSFEEIISIVKAEYPTRYAMKQAADAKEASVQQTLSQFMEEYSVKKCANRKLRERALKGLTPLLNIPVVNATTAPEPSSLEYPIHGEFCYCSSCVAVKYEEMLDLQETYLPCSESNLSQEANEAMNRKIMPFIVNKGMARMSVPETPFSADERTPVKTDKEGGAFDISTPNSTGTTITEEATPVNIREYFPIYSAGAYSGDENTGSKQVQKAKRAARRFKVEPKQMFP